MFRFQEIIGHSELKDNLLKISNSSKLPHSYLFSGKMGYATFGISVAFLKYLYCENKTDTDSCNECSSCQKINTFQHPDVHYILPSFSTKELSRDLLPKFSNFINEKGMIFDVKDWMEYNQSDNSKIRSAEIDHILHQANMSSYMGGYTTIVIWNFESIGKEQNKLLKILEEPPLKTRFILISENSNLILPTVISRCSIQSVNRYSNEEVHQYLEEKTIDTSPDQLDICQGNLILAKRYFESSNKEMELDEMLLFYLKGFIKFHERKITNIQHVLKISNDLASESKNNCKKFFEYHLSFLRQILIYKYTEKHQVSEKLEKALIYFSSSLEIDQIDLWIEYVENTIRHLHGNINKRICFVSLAVKVGRLQSRTEFEKIERV